jgi:hypothetical protein
MWFFLLQRKTLVTISTRTTDRSHFLIFANTYEAALYMLFTVAKDNDQQILDIELVLTNYCTM